MPDCNDNDHCDGGCGPDDNVDKKKDYNDDDDNLGGDAAIIRDNGFNQGHLLQDHKQEALHYRDNHRNSLLFFKIFNNPLPANMRGR